MNKSYFLIICLILTSFTGCIEDPALEPADTNREWDFFAIEVDHDIVANLSNHVAIGIANLGSHSADFDVSFNSSYPMHFTEGGTKVELSLEPGDVQILILEINSTSDFYSADISANMNWDGGSSSKSISLNFNYVPKGERVEVGDAADFHYAGFLERNGRLFDTSIEYVWDNYDYFMEGTTDANRHTDSILALNVGCNAEGDPSEYCEGSRRMITGFDQGMVGMYEGQTLYVVIPPEDAYGTSGSNDLAGETLIFSIRIVSVEKPGGGDPPSEQWTFYRNFDECDPDANSLVSYNEFVNCLNMDLQNDGESSVSSWEEFPNEVFSLADLDIDVNLTESEFDCIKNYPHTNPNDNSNAIWCNSEVPLNLTFEILSEHPFECMNGNVFDKFINVFGVYVVGTPGASLEYFNHTANILAQLIDNNEDGIPDDSAVLDILVDNNFVVPVWSEDDSEDFWDEIQGTYCEDNIGMAASMYYDGDQWAIGGIEEAGTWDTNLEEVWHIVSVGWYEAYPQYFGTDFDDNNEVIPSNLTDAMDAARGGQFMSIPDEYPEEAWYAYYDDTCDYHCQAHEYFYWILMANIGALDASLTDKCEDSKDEWYVCTKADLETVDVLAFDLLNNPIFNLPTIIPDGSYMDFNQNTNSPPTVTGVAITPNQASEGDILTCSYTFTDPDSDPDYSVFSWFVNGQMSDGHNSDTFSSEFVSGDSVSCSVTAHDGNGAGNTAESEAITISDD